LASDVILGQGSLNTADTSKNYSKKYYFSDTLNVL